MAADVRRAVGRSVVRPVYIYFRCFTAQLKSILAYKADFFVLVASAALVQIIGFAFIWTIFRQIPSINGWTMWEVVMMYALVFLTEGVGSLFFEGTWMLGYLIWRGEFDTVLIRPVSPILQVFTSKVGMNGIGNIATGTVLIVIAIGQSPVAWTAGRVVTLLVLVVSAMVIRVSINLGTAASAFWTRNPWSAVPMFAHQLGDFAKYPLTIYSFAVQVAIVVAIPFAFVSFFPTAVAFGEEPWVMPGLLTPLVAAYCAFMAVAIFRLGMRRYESAGH